MHKIKSFMTHSQRLISIYVFYNLIYFILQPAFQVADNLRCLKSKNMLKTIVDDTSVSMQKLTKNHLQCQLLKQEIPILEVC